MISDRSLYEKTPAMLHAVDAEGYIIAVSDRWLATLGYSREAVMGERWQRFLTPHSQADLPQSGLPQCWHPGALPEVPVQLVKRNGEIMRAVLSTTLMPSEDGSSAYCLGILTDVTEVHRIEQELDQYRSRLEQLVRDRTADLSQANQKLEQEIRDREAAEAALRYSEALYRASFDQVPVGIVHTPPDCRFQRFNQRFCTMLGYTEAELAQITVADITHPDDRTLHLADYQRLLNGEIADFSLEKRYVRQDGSILWAETTVTVVRDEVGEILFALAVVQDIGDRKAAELALKASEKRFQLIAENILDTFWIDDVRTRRPVYSSPSFETLWGLTPADIEQGFEPLIARIHPEDRDNYLTWMGQAFTAVHGCEVEFRIQHPASGVRWLYQRCFPVLDDTGQPQQLVGITSDITARKQAEQALRTSEEQFRLITETIQDCFWIDDVATRSSLYNSPGIQALWGLTGECLVQSLEPLLERVHPDDREEVRQSLNAQFSLTQPHEREFRICHPGGAIRWVKERLFPLLDASGRPYQVVGVTADITAYKETLAALRQSEERFRLIAETIDDGFWIDDVETRRALYDSPKIAEICGVSLAALHENLEILMDRVHPEDLETFQRVFHSQFSATEPQSLEFRIIRDDASVRWLRRRTFPRFNAQGKLTWVVGVTADVTDQKQAQASLQRYARMVEAATDGICLLDREYRYQIINRTYADWYGYAGRPILGQTVAEVLGQAAFEQRLQPLLDRCLSGESLRYADWFEFPHLGQRFRSVTLTPFTESNGEVTGIVTSICDLTALKQSETRQQELLEVIAATPDFVGMSRPSGEIVYLNPAFEQLFATESGGTQLPTYIQGCHPQWALERIFQEGIPGAVQAGTWSGESALLTPDGQEIPVSQTITAHRDLAGEVTLLSTILHDIRQQKSLEQQLRDRLQFEQLLSRISAQFVDLPSDSLITGIEQALQAIAETIGIDRSCVYLLSADQSLGYQFCAWQQADLPPLPPHWQTVPVTPLHEWMRQLHQRQVIVFSSLSELPLAAGDERWAVESIGLQSLAVVPMFHRQSLIGCVGFATVTAEKQWSVDEITLLQLVGDLFATAYQRQQFDEALRRQEHYFRILTEQALDIVVLLDEQGVFQYGTPAMTHVLGYLPEEIIGQRAVDFVPPEEIPVILQILQAAIAQPGVSQPIVQYRVRHQSGSWRYFEAITTSLLHDPIVQGVVVNCRDVSDRLQAEAAQRQSDLRFQAFFEQSAISMSQITLEGTYIRVNPAFCQLVGYTAADLIGEHYRKVTHPDDLAYDTQLSNEVASGMVPSHTIDKRVIRSDGEVRYVQVVVTAVQGEQHTPAFLAVVYNDLTERRIAENALRSVVEGTAAVVGEQFFPVLAQNLAATLAVDHVFISQVVGDAFQPLVYWNEHQEKPFPGYPMKGTPCARSLAEGLYYCPNNLQAQFPDDTDLVSLQAESYIGVALIGSNGQSLGAICVLHSQPINHLESAIALLKIFAARSSAELERQRSNQALQDSEARFQRLAANMPGVIYRYYRFPDGSDRFSYVSPRSIDLWGLDAEAVCANASLAWGLVHPDDVAALSASVLTVTKQHSQWFNEHRIITPTGQQKWIQAVAKVVPQPDGSYMWDGMLIDITARKQAELALQASEARFQRLAANMPGIIYRYHQNLDGSDRFSYLSAACREIWEIEPAPLLQDCTPLWQLVHEADRDRLRSALQTTRQHLTPLFATYRVVTPSGQLKWMQILARPVREPDGSCFWDGIVIDITEQKAIEQALRQSEALNRAILAALPDLLIRIRRDGLCLDMQYLTTFPILCPRADHVGRNIRQTLPSDIAAERLAAIEQALTTGDMQVYEYQIQVNQACRWEEARVVPLGWDEALVLVRDIDDRKQAEAALKASEALNRAIIETLPDMLVRMRQDGLVLGASHATDFPAVVSAAQSIGQNIRDMLPDAVVQKRLAMTAQVLKTRQTQVAEYQIGVQDQLRWEEMRVVALTDDEVIVLIRDIDERKRTEQEVHRLNQALEQQNQQLEELVEQRTAELLTFINALPDQIFVVDRATNQMPFGNDGVARFAGKASRKAFEGQTLASCYPTDLAAYYEAQNQQVFATGEVLHIEEAIATAEGVLYFDTYKIPLKHPNGEVYALIGSSRDITELVKTRQALEAQAIQLEATNQELQAFSYSVSHDLRAPLRHVSGFISALTQRLGPVVEQDPKIAHYLDVIASSSQKMGRLIDGLLTLSRVGRRELALQPVDLMGLVENTLALLDQVPADPQSLQVTLAALPTVQGDPTLLQQVFVNLLDNAIKFSRDRTPICIHIGQDAEGSLFIRDNGVGFDMAYADKLFSPFQRLHRAEEFGGTGIGLAIVQRIIHRHGGHIWVESIPDQGTTFYFTIPAVADSATG